MIKSFLIEFKTLIVTLILIFLAFFVYTKLAGPIPFFVQSIQTTKTDLFSANGEGKVTEVPNSAQFSVGVTAQGQTVAEAQNKANEASSKIIDSIKSLGVNDKDIKTTNYSVNPNYGSGGIEPLAMRVGGQEAIVGYTVTQNLEVNVKPIENVNKVVDAATGSGANLVGGVTFTFSDDLKNSLEDKARKIAVEDAKKKAQSLASAAGVRLGRVINVIESSNGSAIPLAYQANAKSDAGAETNITPGENSIIVNVTIYYETY